MSEDSEVNEVYNKINDPERTKVPNMEYVKDAEGKIIDVVFAYEKDRVNLKQLLPGSYFLEIMTEGDPSIPGPSGGYSNFGDKVKLNSYLIPGGVGSGTFFGVLLHEAGHAVMFAEQDPEMFNALSDMRSWVAKYWLLERFTENLLTPENIENIRLNDLEHSIETYKIPEHLALSMREGFTKAVEEVKGLDKSTLDTYRNQFEHEGDLTDMQLTKISERGAWAHALKAARELKKMRIADFKENDLINLTRVSLLTYQTGVKDEIIQCVQPHQRIVRGRLISESS